MTASGHHCMDWAEMPNNQDQDDDKRINHLHTTFYFFWIMKTNSSICIMEWSRMHFYATEYFGKITYRIILILFYPSRPDISSSSSTIFWYRSLWQLNNELDKFWRNIFQVENIAMIGFHCNIQILTNDQPVNINHIFIVKPTA